MVPTVFIGSIPPPKQLPVFHPALIETKTG
jgi:hypothetical protein